MISIIKGKIFSKTLTELVVLTSSGVGYKVFINPTKLDNYKVGIEVEILTHLIVREVSQDLYGFENDEEREMFVLALSVSGIGPKSALQLLSLGSVSEIKNAIVSEDVSYISKVNGVGKKTAQRLILELKNKIDFIGVGNKIGSSQGGSIGDVIDALVSMGYKVQQARDAVKDLDKNKTSEELLKEALKQVR